MSNTTMEPKLDAPLADQAVDQKVGGERKKDADGRDIVEISASVEWDNDEPLKIPEGEHWVFKENATLKGKTIEVPKGATLEIREGSKAEEYASVIARNGSKVDIKAEKAIVVEERGADVTVKAKKLIYYTYPGTRFEDPKINSKQIKADDQVEIRYLEKDTLEDSEFRQLFRDKSKRQELLDQLLSKQGEKEMAPAA